MRAVRWTVAKDASEVLTGPLRNVPCAGHSVKVFCVLSQPELLSETALIKTKMKLQDALLIRAQVTPLA